MEGVSADMRSEWRSWAEQEFGSDEQAVDRATDAAVSSLQEGATVEGAMAAARDAVAGGTLTETAEQGEHPVSDEDHLRGQVVSFRERNELMGNRYGSVWDFRVDHWDAEGTLQTPVAVEMRGTRFTGSVGDGDWVEIADSGWKPGQVLHARRLSNLSMNSEVLADGGDEGAGHLVRTGLSLVAKTIFFLIALAIIGAAALLVLSQT